MNNATTTNVSTFIEAPFEFICTGFSKCRAVQFVLIHRQVGHRNIFLEGTAAVWPVSHDTSRLWDRDPGQLIGIYHDKQIANEAIADVEHGDGDEFAMHRRDKRRLA